MRLRFSIGTALVATAIPIPEPLHASAQPIKKPAPIVTATTPLAIAKIMIPKRYKKDPTTITFLKPTRMTNTPVNGCIKPQVRFWIAIASVN